MTEIDVFAPLILTVEIVLFYISHLPNLLKTKNRIIQILSLSNISVPLVSIFVATDNTAVTEDDMYLPLFL